MTLRALPVWPWPPSAVQMDALKEAKSLLALEYKILPVEAKPGTPVTVLAFGEMPPFLCRVALVRGGWWTVDNVKAALHAALEDPEHPALRDELDYLKAVFGPDVKEVDDGGSQERAGGVAGDSPSVAFR